MMTLREKLETLPLLRLFFARPKTLEEHLRRAVVKTVILVAAFGLAAFVLQFMPINARFV